jgi:hypothetical protein
MLSAMLKEKSNEALVVNDATEKSSLKDNPTFNVPPRE